MALPTCPPQFTLRALFLGTGAVCVVLALTFSATVAVAEPVLLLVMLIFTGLSAVGVASRAPLIRGFSIGAFASSSAAMYSLARMFGLGFDWTVFPLREGRTVAGFRQYTPHVEELRRMMAFWIMASLLAGCVSAGYSLLLANSSSRARRCREESANVEPAANPVRGTIA